MSALLANLLADNGVNLSASILQQTEKTKARGVSLPDRKRGSKAQAQPASESNSPSDRELISQCLQGQKHSYRQLYRRYQSSVRSTLYQLCGAAYLDDLVQEVFLRVWKGLPKFRQTSQFSTWLYRITWNVAADQRRQFAKANQQQQAIRLGMADAIAQSSPEDSQTVSPSSDHSNLMRLHYQDLVQRGLATLSLEHRAVLVLHDLEDLPQKEVAKILAVPVGTVKSRLFHARAAMRQFLQQEGVQL